MYLLCMPKKKAVMRDVEMIYKSIFLFDLVFVPTRQERSPYVNHSPILNLKLKYKKEERKLLKTRKSTPSQPENLNQ